MTTQVGTGNTFTPSIDNTVAGTYTFYATQTANGCESQSTAVTVTINANPVKPIISGTTTFCQGSSTTLTSSAATGNQWLLNGNPIAGATNQTLVVTSAGSYTVTVTNASSCTNTSNAVTVTQTAQPSAPTASNIAYCQNETATALTASGSNLLWYTAATGGTGSTTAPVPSTATAGTTNYYVSQTVNGCESPRTTITVTVNTVPAAPTASSPAPICVGQAIPQLTATGTSIRWFSDAGLTTQVGTGNSFTPSISNNIAGTSTFYASQTVNGCQSTATAVTITINANPAKPTISGTTTFCQGSNTTLTTSATTGIQWNLNGSPISGATNQTLTVITAGNYTITETNSSCSTTSDPVTVTQTAQPSAPTVSDVDYCQNAPATPLTASGSNLLWYPSAAGGSGSTTAPTPSTGTVGITDYFVSQTVSGCESSRARITVTINAIPAAPAASSPAPICAGQAVPQLTAMGSNITWYNNTTTVVGRGSTFTPPIDNTVAGTTTFFATQTVNGCESQSTAVTVTINPNPAQPTISGTATFCQGGNTILTTDATAGIQWFLNSNPISGATAQAFTATVAGNYTVSTTNGSGCANTSAAFSVTQTAQPAAPTVTNVTYCQNETATALTAGGSNLLWYTAAMGGTSSATAPVPATSTVGSVDYYVSQTVNGCESQRARITVTVNPAPSQPTISGNNTFCPGGSTVLTSSSATGNQWLLNGNPIGGATNQTLNVTAAGNYSVVTQTSCSATSATVSVTESTLATPTISGNNTFCAGSSTTLTTSATTGIQWLLNGSPIASATAQSLNVTTAGDYSVTVTNGSCSATSAVTTITQTAAPVVTASSNGPVCEGSTINLSASAVNNATYSWTGPNGFTSSLQNPVINNATATHAGTYSVTVTVNACASAPATVNVVVDPQVATPTISGNKQLLPGGNTVLTSSAATGNQWLLNGNPITGATAQTLTVTTTGNYSVQITTTTGCSATSTALTVTQTTPAQPTISGTTAFAEEVLP